MGHFYADKVSADDNSGVTLVDKLPLNKYRDGMAARKIRMVKLKKKK